MQVFLDVRNETKLNYFRISTSCRPKENSDFEKLETEDKHT